MDVNCRSRTEALKHGQDFSRQRGRGDVWVGWWVLVNSVSKGPCGRLSISWFGQGREGLCGGVARIK